MKRKLFGMTGMLAALLLTFGLAVIGCDNGTTSGGGAASSVERSPKSVRVTGLPTGKRGVYVGVSPGGGTQNVACGWSDLGTVTDVTFSLKIPNENGGATDSNWTGSGEYFLILNIFDTEGDLNTDNYTTYFYSNGDTIPSNMSSGVKKVNFDESTRTIDFSKFAHPQG